MIDFSSGLDIMKSFMKLPMVGPLNRYQEKWNHFFKCWMDVITTSAGFSKEIFNEFVKGYFTQLPEYMSGFFQNPPQTLLKGLDQYIKFLDQIWGKLIRSEEYAAKSADMLNRWVDLRKSIESIWEDWQELLPFVSPQQMEELAAKIKRVEEQLRESEKY